MSITILLDTTSLYSIERGISTATVFKRIWFKL